MSIYSAGATAYRDTTKWLAAFVPLTALVTAALTLGPPVVQSIRDSSSLQSWITAHWLVLVCAVVLFAGLTAILSFGAKVLSVEPNDIGDLITSPKKRSELAAAIGSGATAPWFLNKSSFDTAMAAMANALDDPTRPIATDDPRSVRLQSAIEALREWSIYHRIQKAYRNFRYAFIASSIVIGAAVLVAPTQLESSIPIDKPTLIQAEVDDSGAKELFNKTGCSDPKASTFLAIGGTWYQPELAVDGPGCAFGAIWHPNPGRLELRLPSSP